MNKIVKTAMAAVVSTGLIASAAAIPSVASAQSYGCRVVTQDKARTGTILGALIGGALGGTVADTHNKGVGVAAGAVVGGLVGHSIGKDRGREDCYQARTQPTRYYGYERHNYNRDRGYGYGYDRNYNHRYDGRYDSRW